MKATLLKTQKEISKMGGIFYYAFFKDSDGKSYRSCLYPNFRNFKNWQTFIGKENVLLDNLTMKGRLINADSQPVEIKEEKQLELF